VVSRPQAHVHIPRDVHARATGRETTGEETRHYSSAKEGFMTKAFIVLLLCSPIELPVTHRASPPLWQALKAVAEQLEVTGPHERWIDDFASEVRYVRHHLRELHDAPSLLDCDLLPPRPLALCMQAFYLQRQLYLEHMRRIKLHREEEIDGLLAKARCEAKVWMLIDCATNETQSWPCRRRALRQLWEME
jgi:hypothetical protein